MYVFEFVFEIKNKKILINKVEKALNNVPFFCQQTFVSWPELRFNNFSLPLKQILKSTSWADPTQFDSRQLVPCHLTIDRS